VASNYDAWLVFSILSTQSIDSNIGLIKYDGALVRELADLFGVEENRRAPLAGKVLYLVSEQNQYRMTEMAEEREAREKRLAVKGARGVPDDDPAS
jgi:hypothetical protein